MRVPSRVYVERPEALPRAAPPGAQRKPSRPLPKHEPDPQPTHEAATDGHDHRGAAETDAGDRKRPAAAVSADQPEDHGHDAADDADRRAEHAAAQRAKGGRADGDDADDHRRQREPFLLLVVAQPAE